MSKAAKSGGGDQFMPYKEQDNKASVSKQIGKTLRSPAKIRIAAGVRN